MTLSDIDIDCLYLEWHPKVKEFITGFKKEDLYKLLEDTQPSFLSQQYFNQLVNLYNDDLNKELYKKILKAEDKTTLIGLLKERDVILPRDRRLDFNIIFESVIKDNYHPAFIFELDNEIFIVDGRTRLFCCEVLNKPLLIRKLTDKTIYEYCRK